MKRSNEIEAINEMFYSMGRADKQHLLTSSNLDDYEINILSSFYIKGKKKLDIADEVCLEYSAFNKLFRKICQKLYLWLELNHMISKIV